MVDVRLQNHFQSRLNSLMPTSTPCQEAKGKMLGQGPGRANLRRMPTRTFTPTLTKILTKLAISANYIFRC